MMAARALRALVVSNSRTPNNDALFRELAGQPSLDLLVAYCRDRESFRQWNLEPAEGYAHVTMPGWTWGASTHVNPEVVALVRRFVPDAAVLTGSYTMPTFHIAAATLGVRRTPWLYWGEPLQFDRAGWLRTRTRTLLRRTIRTASGVLAIGRRAVESYASIGVPRSRIANFHYYANVEDFVLPEDERRRHRAEVRARFGVPASALVFLFAGQLIHRKGVDTLIEAAARLHARGGDFEVLIVGDGPDREHLRALADRLGIAPRIHFTGFAEPRDLPTLFAAGDAFVLPSRQEGWGMVVPEAMAAGMPVLASDAVNSAAELVEPGVSGWLFPADDPDALASAMHELVLMPSRVACMAVRAGAIAAAESPRRAAPRLARILHAVRDATDIDTL